MDSATAAVQRLTIYLVICHTRPTAPPQQATNPCLPEPRSRPSSPPCTTSCHSLKCFTLPTSRLPRLLTSAHTDATLCPRPRTMEPRRRTSTRTRPELIASLSPVSKHLHARLRHHTTKLLHLALLSQLSYGSDHCSPIKGCVHSSRTTRRAGRGSDDQFTKSKLCAQTRHSRPPATPLCQTNSHTHAPNSRYTTYSRRPASGAWRL